MSFTGNRKSNKGKETTFLLDPKWQLLSLPFPVVLASGLKACLRESLSYDDILKNLIEIVGKPATSKGLPKLQVSLLLTDSTYESNMGAFVTSFWSEAEIRCQ